jgi:16S rRNA (guanine966-N2)-methyltransferase
MRLRVIAGEYGGRILKTPDGFTTHPMGERIKGALFNKLGDITGKTVLDPFSGSGALSFEALSRGAASALLIERDRRAQDVIIENIQSLGLDEKAHLVRANCRLWSEQHPDDLFDLVVCDPPYTDFKLSTINLMVKHIHDGGTMILSYPGRECEPTVNGVVVVDKSFYGDAALAFYRKEVA